METPTPAEILASFTNVAQRIERLLDERTTNQANHTQLIVEGLRDDVTGLTEAVHQVSDGMVAMRREVGQAVSLITEVRELLVRQGSDLVSHEQRLRRLEGGSGRHIVVDVAPFGD